jgi:DNA replication and repair protein RecF
LPFKIHGVLSELRLRNFRCFESLDFTPPPGLSFITGRNAQGKTSLLEAACMLLRLQSPRTTDATELIRSGSSTLSLSGLCADSRLEFRLGPAGRTILLDSKPQPKSADYLTRGRVTWFANSDLELVKGPASARRRYLDFLGAQCIPGYAPALRSYERALRSRNALLREHRPRREIEAFDPLLCETGETLLLARASLCTAIAPLALAACSEISGGSDTLEISHQPGATLPFAESLAASRTEEERLRQTLRGPHRDDLVLKLNSRPAAPFASEGQQRTIALALKIAQARHLASAHGAPPLLLLDDIFGELDPIRRNLLLASLPSAQALATTTFLDWSTLPEGTPTFHLESHRLEQK